MKIIKRILIGSDTKHLLDSIANTDNYPKNLDIKRGNEDVIAKALDKDLIEVYMQSSGIDIGDIHFEHEAYRLTERGKLYATSAKEKIEFKKYKGNVYAWSFGVLGTVIAALILYSFGIGR